MEKYQNKSPIMRFVHKNTGFIVCGIVLVVLVSLWINEQGKLYFFEKWTCEQLKIYILSDGNGRFPKHNELSEEQHIKLHQVLSECPQGFFEHK